MRRDERIVRGSMGHMKAMMMMLLLLLLEVSEVLIDVDTMCLWNFGELIGVTTKSN